MPGLTTSTYGTGDYSWLLNTDGLDAAVTGALDVSTFVAGTHYPNGYFPSGLPVRIDDRDAHGFAHDLMHGNEDPGHHH